VGNCSKGTILQHHSSENKNVPAHRIVTEYIVLTNHVACVYSHIPFMTPNVQKADVAASDKCANSVRQTIAVINFQATVCFSCGVGAPTFMILFALSPTTVAYIKPQRTCKSSTLVELTYFMCSPLPERFICEKATALPHMENNIQI